MSTGLRGWWQRRAVDEVAGPATQDHGRATLQLASADGCLYFSADIAFWAWWGGGDETSASLWDIARSGITDRAEAVSTRHRLTATERVRAELNTALVSWKPVGHTPAQARGHCVSVQADPELLAAVAEHEQSVRQQVVISWNEQRIKQRREQMCSLLLDPLQATAWWLQDNQDKVGDVLTVAKTFQELQEVVKPAAESASAGKLIDDLLDTKDKAVKAHAVHTLRKFFLAYEREDLAAQLSAFED